MPDASTITAADVRRAIASFDWDAWRDELRDRYETWYRDTLDAAGEQAAADLGGEWKADDPYVSRFADRYVGERITQLDETTRDDVRDTLNSLFDARDADGEAVTQRDIADALREKFDEFAGSRAGTIARTEVAIVENQGAAMGAVASGFNYVQISDGDGDEECATADGQVWSIDAFLADPIAHPNAVMAGTVVLPIGDVLIGYRALWRGPVVRVRTSGGAEMTVGPNHPVLTARGWIPAKSLCGGDDVLRSLRADWDAAHRASLARVASGNVDQGPTEIAQVFRALKSVPRHARVVAAPTHFHGDGNFCEGEVEIVWTDRALPQEDGATIGKQPRERVFMLADAQLPGLSGSSALASDLKGIDLPAPCGMGGCLTSGRSRDDAPSLLLGLDGRGSADRDAAFTETVRQRPRTDTGLLGDLEQRFAGFVARDQVVDVRHDTAFFGHAFDLETVSHAYFADSILVSNCERSAAPISDEDAQELGIDRE